MRICLVAHGFPPYELTGVENYTETLARALVRAGHRVEVFAPRRSEQLPALSLRREERDGYGVTWVTAGNPPTGPEEMLDPPGAAERFGTFLDRERPELVHFQHLIKLGLGLVEQAHERNIPALLTAHDYYGVCHRFTLMRPDLSRCDVIGDPTACAQCDLALSLLNRCESLGDYHMGAFEDQLDPSVWNAVGETLSGNPTKAGFPKEEVAAAEERRATLDERRRKVFASFERVFAPTRFLGDALIRGGVASEKVRHLPYGIETGALESVGPVVAEGRRLRVGFLGGMAKHKGVHVLLDAFPALGESVELHLWGGSSDSVYVERMRADAERVGAIWHGTYQQPQLAENLAQVDVVVVPSIWVENYPIVIREAFAAGRPVVTGQFGALPESVRDGVDGLLFRPGDSVDLARVLRRIAEEPGLLEELVAGISRVKSIDEQVVELIPHYEEVIAARAVPELDLPGSLVDAYDAFQELDGLPTRDLFLKCIQGLESVQGRLLEDAPPVTSLVAEGLSANSEAQTLLRDLARASKYQESEIENATRAVEEIAKRDAWRASELDTEREAVEYQKGLAEANRAELVWLRELHAALEEKSAWQEQELGNVTERAEWLSQKVDDESKRAEWLEGERSALTEKAEWLDSERSNAHDRVQDLEFRLATAVAELATKKQEIQSAHEERVRAEEAFLGERGAFVELLRHTVALGLTAHTGDASESRSLQELMELLSQSDHTSEERRDFLARAVPATREASSLLERLIDELQWRRDEMHAASDAASRRAVRLLVARTGLGRQIERWTNELDGEMPT